jgi:hypothetical protein
MNDSVKQEREFCTSDIDIAAFLTANNIPMEGVIRDQDHLTFVFSQHQDCHTLSARFMSGNDTVSARSVLSASKHLRRIVRETL